MDMVLLYLRIRPDRIGYLKFLLEGYDGLAILTTIDSNYGLIRLALSRPRYVEAVCFLQSVAGELTV